MGPREEAATPSAARRGLYGVQPGFCLVVVTLFNCINTAKAIY